jgi:predicted HNH restriction endonuclease
LEAILARLAQAGLKPNIFLDSDRVQDRPLADRRIARTSDLVGSVAEQFNFLIRESNADGPSHGAYKRLLLRVRSTADDQLKAILEGRDLGSRTNSAVRQPDAAGPPSDTRPDDVQSRIPLTDEEQSWVEGNVKIAAHLRRERSGSLPKKFKADFRTLHGRLFCERCERDYVDVYGAALAEACFEAHHTVPVSEMPEGHETKLDQLRLLCANCHRAVHREMVKG